MTKQGLSVGDDASELAPGDFVSFVFNNERHIGYLTSNELGLRSSERTRGGYRPFIAKRAGTVAAGVSRLHKLHRDEVIQVLAAVMLRPGNEHLALRAKELLDG